MLRRNEGWPPEQPAESTMELHVVYHPSFQVPTLLFKVFRLDGSLVPLTEILHHFSHLPVVVPGSQAVTQAEHPILGEPFLMLHPCQTQESMATMKMHNAASSSVQTNTNPHAGGVSYLKAWLSLVESTIGVRSSLPLWTS